MATIDRTSVLARPRTFSSGEALARRLESLGFDVERVDADWAEEERILVLDLYLRSDCLNEADSGVEELCQVLNAVNAHSVRRGPDRVRTPGTVRLKLRNFAWLDPNHEGGLSNAAAGR